MCIELKVLLLTAVANGAPPVARNLLTTRFAQPLDGGVRFLDGQPLLGSSKTLRGILAAVLATAATALLLGLSWQIGVTIAVCAMLGDLLSSFIKRRLRIAPAGHAPLLDQVPESLFPLLAVRAILELSWVSILAVVIAFLLLHRMLSPLLFRLHIRDRPY